MNSFIAETEKVLGRHWRLAYMGFALVIAVLYDVFFWDLRLGLGFFVFVFCYLFGFITLSAITKQFREPKALLLLIPILALSVDVVLYNNRLVTELVPWAVMILLFLFSVLLTLQNPHKYQFSLSRIPIFRNIEITFFQWSDMWRDLFRWKLEGKKKVVTKILWGVVFAIPLLLVFGGLFAAADAVFADVLNNVFDFDIKASTVWRIFRTGVIMIYLSSIFYALLSKKNALQEKVQRAIKLDPTIIGTILALINGLFFVFVLIQFRYLFGGAEYVFEQEITFADYARNGFFQLVWVIGLAALMLIFLYRSAAHHGSHAVLKFLKVFLIVQVAVIAVSALHRMNLYQDVFGFTVLRLYVEWFIYFSLGILVLAGGSILINWPFRSFFYTTMVLGLAAFGIVASINVDRMIARENVDRFLEEGRELDINYLVHTLSPDTIPEIQRINERGDYLYQREQKEDGAFSVVHNNLGNSVVVSIKYYPKTHSWREYNFGLEEAQKVADKLPKF